MKKAFEFFIGLSMVILFIAGIFAIIEAFRSSHGGIYFLYGLSCWLSAFVLYGFSIIVDAAELYINKNKKAEE